MLTESQVLDQVLLLLELLVLVLDHVLELLAVLEDHEDLLVHLAVLRREAQVEDLVDARDLRVDRELVLLEEEVLEVLFRRVRAVLLVDRAPHLLEADQAPPDAARRADSPHPRSTRNGSRRGLQYESAERTGRAQR